MSPGIEKEILEYDGMGMLAPPYCTKKEYLRSSNKGYRDALYVRKRIGSADLGGLGPEIALLEGVGYSVDEPVPMGEYGIGKPPCTIVSIGDRKEFEEFYKAVRSRSHEAGMPDLLTDRFGGFTRPIKYRDGGREFWVPTIFLHSPPNPMTDVCKLHEQVHWARKHVSPGDVEMFLLHDRFYSDIVAYHSSSITSKGVRYSTEFLFYILDRLGEPNALEKAADYARARVFRDFARLDLPGRVKFAMDKLAPDAEQGIPKPVLARTDWNEFIDLLKGLYKGETVDGIVDRKTEAGLWRWEVMAERCRKG